MKALFPGMSQTLPLISAALAQPTSEELTRNLPRQNSLEIIPSILPEEIKEDITQQIDLREQDQIYSDIIDIIEQDQEEAQQEFDQELQEAEDGIQIAENQPLLPQQEQPDARLSIIEQIEQRQGEDNDDDFYLRQNIARYILSNLALLTVEDIYKIYNNMGQIVEIYREQKFKDSLLQNEQNTTIQELKERKIPAHCRRHIYFDAQGQLHSVVICGSSNQRVYNEL